ncbi:MAG TPA: ATP:cob(I)alamin adenosyltransferase [Elusimicrobiales bacterium]|nr:ATP:cob(I)alamin adenosyltransferase [Elusimicrobiales bacterium]
MATKKPFLSGDSGFTSLPEGARVPKNHPRIRFFGALDELTCRLGVARLAVSKTDATLLLRFQQALIHAAAGNGNSATKLKTELVYLEAKTKALEKKLPPLKKFLLPGDNVAETALHCARSACRAAELKACILPNNTLAAVYLNRLSRCLFALARLQSAK